MNICLSCNEISDDDVKECHVCSHSTVVSIEEVVDMANAYLSIIRRREEGLSDFIGDDV